MQFPICIGTGSAGTLSCWTCFSISSSETSRYNPFALRRSSITRSDAAKRILYFYFRIFHLIKALRVWIRITLMNKSCHAVPIAIGSVSASYYKGPKKRIEQSSPPFKGGESPRSRAGVVLVYLGRHHPVSCCALRAPRCHPSSTRRGA